MPDKFGKETPRERAERKKADADPYYYMMSTSAWSRDMAEDIEKTKPSERFTPKRFEMDNADMRIKESKTHRMVEALIALLILWGVYWLVGTYLP